MNEIKIKKDQLIVNDVVSVEKEPENQYLHPANRIPNEWRISALTDTTIRAVNNTSKDVFEGTYGDFNKILKG